MLAELMDFDPKDPRSQEEWALHHLSDHQAIRDQTQVQGYGNLTEWQLYPINWADWSAYALRHQSAHNEFNNALGLPGQDLTEVDFNDPKAREEWNSEHFAEHLHARTKLGI